MKALCINSDKHSSNVNTELVVGKEYVIEDAITGTSQQNKAFHALCQEYHRSGLHSYSNSFTTFRDEIKKYLGAGFESYVYATIENNKANLEKANTYEEIPEYIRKDPDLKRMVMGRLKSWSDYTKKERRETMDRLISEMRQVGVSTKKFDEIIKGMEGC